MAARRYRALLIGNAVFPRDPHGLPALDGPLTDIEFLQQALTDHEVGLFVPHDVDLRPDCSVQQLRERIDAFYSSAKREDVLLLYYSGHGELDIQGTLYLCAHDSKSSSLRSTALSSIEINNMIDGSAAATTIVMLDCCHSGAFKGGPKAPTAGRGRYVLTSNRHTQLARAAAQPGHPSPFTGLLALGLRRAPSEGHLSVTGLYNQVHTWMTSQDPTLVPQLRIAGEGEVIIARRGPTQPFTMPPGPEFSGAGPSQRVPELFDRAVRIADSIDDPEERAAAYIMVGQTAPWLRDDMVLRLPAENRAGVLVELADQTDDVDLALRLLDQAEPLIALIPDPDEHEWHHYTHIHASSRAASLLAKIDPDAARQLMSRVESAGRDLPADPKYTFQLPRLLVEIAIVGRDADPHSSRRLLHLAEQHALSLDDEDDKNFALQIISAGVTPADPDRAERLIGMITGRSSQAAAWADAVEAAVSAGCGHLPYLIDAAERALVSPLRAAETEINTDSHDLVPIAVAAAAADMPRAQRLALRITDHAARAEALTGMARQVTTSSPGQARRWLAAAHKATLQIPTDDDLPGRPRALAEVAAAAANVDPELAATITQRLISSLGMHEWLWTLISVAENVAAVDPAQAVRLVDQAESQSSTREEPLGDQQRLSLADALVTAAVTTADTDSQYAKSLIRRAWQTVHRPAEAKGYIHLRWLPLVALAKKDLYTAEQLIDQLPSSDQDPLLTEIVSALVQTDPGRAQQAAHRITDDTLRKKALVQVALSIAANAQGPHSMDPQ
ncbi:caspase family protein [Streptomyces sp. NBC_00658]|uniref:caspase, EACC1-associated type n=1 Tax=Streptomyces sp. NBC_00658 TaxID=2975800 RepID=UPI003255B954